MPEFLVSVGNESQDAGGRAERAVRSEEDIHVSRFEFARIRCQAFNQFLQSAGLDQPDPDRLPLQMRYIVIRVLSKW